MIFVCIKLLSLTDILPHDVWSLFKQLEDPELQQLARHLPSTRLQSKANTTAKRTANYFVSMVLEGLQSTLAKPVTKKAPINLEILSAMMKDTMENQTLSNARLMSACLLAYAGFLCFNELHNLHLKFDSEKLLIKIRQSKMDQLRKGDEILISRTGTIRNLSIDIVGKAFEFRKN